jgi:hypothetical protein
VIDLVTANGEPAVPKTLASGFTTDELDNVILFTKNQIIRTKTPGQREYLHQIRSNDIVLPSACGDRQDLPGCRLAVASLKNNEITKIVLTARRWKRAKASGFFLEISKRRSTRTSGRSTMRSMT